MELFSNYQFLFIAVRGQFQKTRTRLHSEHEQRDEAAYLQDRLTCRLVDGGVGWWGGVVKFI